MTETAGDFLAAGVGLETAAAEEAAFAEL